MSHNKLVCQITKFHCGNTDDDVGEQTNRYINIRATIRQTIRQT